MGMCTRSLSKKELAILFDCYSPSTGKVDHRKFRRKFMTNKVVKQVLGLSLDEYRRIKVFSFEQTSKLITYFKIEKNELQELQTGSH